MKLQIIMLTLLMVPLGTDARTKKGRQKVVKKSPSHAVSEVMASYRKGKALQAKVKKTVYQETMQTEAKSSGDFYFSKGKMRLDVSEPERTTLVYDGKALWFESRLDDEHVTVTKMKSTELSKSDSILAALFGRKEILQSFTLTQHKKTDFGDSYSFVPKNKKKSEVQLLEIDIAARNVRRISYKDAIENRVTLEFSEINRKGVAPEKFTYKPPRGAEVTSTSP